MPLTPDYTHLTKEQTFSSVAKGTVHLPLALDDNYPVGGYPMTSEILFNTDGFAFRMLDGYATNGTTFRRLIHDVANNKLMVLNSNDAEIGGGTDLSTYTAFCTFHRW
ncbi:MAG: hypothetical protein Q7U75_19420 [Desulfobacterales bacterium]|nr:hypothetical protein [Desulfobacterales bacterium]